VTDFQINSLEYPPAMVFSIIYSDVSEDSAPIKMLLSDMWAWGLRADNVTKNEIQAELDDLDELTSIYGVKLRTTFMRQ
jgi:hypothetical protein